MESESDEPPGITDGPLQRPNAATFVAQLSPLIRELDEALSLLETHRLATFSARQVDIAQTILRFAEKYKAAEIREASALLCSWLSATNTHPIKLSRGQISATRALVSLIREMVHDVSLNRTPKLEKRVTRVLQRHLDQLLSPVVASMAVDSTTNQVTPVRVPVIVEDTVSLDQIPRFLDVAVPVTQSIRETLGSLRSDRLSFVARERLSTDLLKLSASSASVGLNRISEAAKSVNVELPEIKEGSKAQRGISHELHERLNDLVTQIDYLSVPTPISIIDPLILAGSDGFRSDPGSGLLFLANRRDPSRYLRWSAGTEELPVSMESGKEFPESTTVKSGAFTEQLVPYIPQRVFFATDRKDTESEDVIKRFDDTRGTGVTMGTAVVSIPEGHQIGKMERPFSIPILGIRFPENPKKHIALQSIAVETESNYFKLINETLSKSERKRTFVFVHGYNVSFEDAARRTAQMAHDLKYDGAPIFYSWPSNANYLEYPGDVQNIEWSEPHIAHFIEQIAAFTEAKEIFLIGHSMGARGLANVAVSLLSAQRQKTNIKGIILSAPDIDSDIFRTRIAPRLVGNTNLTLYASGDDFALNLSKRINGYPRAGDAEGGVMTIPGMDSIDATGIDASFTGHSYFSTVRSVISDIFYIVNAGLPPALRHGLIQEIDMTGNCYWRFQL